MPVEDTPIRDKAVRLFTYLKELALLRTPPVRDYSSYESVLWFHEVPHEPGCFTVAWGAEKAGDNIWLEVQKRKEPPCPPAPEICTDWIDPAAVHNSAGEPQLKERILASQPTSSQDQAPNPQIYNDDTSLNFLDIKDHPEVQERWLEYLIERWSPWAEEHRRWESIQAVYGKLFMIYQQQKRLGEAYELVLGLGLLTWISPSKQRIRRHLLVGQANISFDSNQGTLSVYSGSDGVKLALEADMLEPTECPAVEQQLTFEKSVEAASESPWDRGIIEPILRGWVHAIDPTGAYSDRLETPTQTTAKPEVTFAPALILRKRTARSLVSFLDTTIEKIKQEGEIPFGVRRLCEIIEDKDAPDKTDQPLGFDREERPDVDTEVYFPLLKNEEQHRIVERLRSRQGVLVQGPPGTGKSHTIANLICHLLANGKRVLVTSQTPRALKVLKNMIPKQLSDLCVSALGNDVFSLRDLENSVLGITNRYYGWDREVNEREVRNFEKKIYALRKRRALIEQHIRELREKETYQHVIAGGVYQGTAQSIAKAVAAAEPAYGWFPDKLDEHTEVPFNLPQFQNLLTAYRRLPEARCYALAQPVIAQQELPDVTTFLALVEQERNASEMCSRYESRWSLPSVQLLRSAGKSARQATVNAMRNLQAAVGNIRRRPLPWIPRAIHGMLTDHDRPWRELRETSAKSLRGLLGRSQAAQARSVDIPTGFDRQKLRADAVNLLSHLNAGGSLGWWLFRKDVVKRGLYLTKDVRVNGHTCDNTETLSELLRNLDVESSLEQLWDAWRGIAKRTEGPLPRQVSELEEHVEALDLVLDLQQPLDIAKNTLASITGLAEPAWHDDDSISALLDGLEALEAETSYGEAKSCIEHYITALHAFSSHPNSHEINKAAIKALQDRDHTAWGAVLHEMEGMEDDRCLLQERDGLTKKLSKVAPRLAASISQSPTDPVWDGRLVKIEETWAWARADAWLRTFHSRRNTIELERELQKVQKSLGETIANLAAAKAWGTCIERMTEEQQQHLKAWTKEVKRIGKGTGKHAERHRRAAQKHMDKCRVAIPAWIMPFYRVAETVAPEPNSFDVVIVDEASQSGPDTLMLQYLGKKCIVVGDDQQISPDFVGIDQNAVQLLIERYISDFPLKNTYDVGNSFFAHAEIRYSGRIVLREHFRCVPEIIRFSNDLCYSATPLVPLRQYPPQRLEPLMPRHVPEGFREGGTSAAQNRPEADALVNAICKCCSDPAYEGKTMGVISLQGDRQARVIEKLLINRLEPQEIERRQLVCGDAYAFQGDERDIMFLSMVAAPNERIGPLVREDAKRRFNVSASRARDQMWLFHTATLNDLNPNDMRYKLLHYCINPDRSPNGAPDWDRCESGFEHEVGGRIHARGYRVLVQYEPFGTGGKRIDLVVEGSKSRLAVECDGDYWHGPEQYEQDMFRQRQLERCHWVFWRVRGSTFYRNPDKALEPLWARLAEMDIYPAGNEPSPPIAPARADLETTIAEPDSRLFRAMEEVRPLQNETSSTTMPPRQGSLLARESLGFDGRRDIADIHQDEIHTALHKCLPESGQIEREIVLRDAAQRLGFSKLGKRIRSRLNRAIGGAIRAGRLRTNGEKIWRSNL